MVGKRNGGRNQDDRSKRSKALGLTRLPLKYPRIGSGESADLDGRRPIINIPPYLLQHSMGILKRAVLAQGA